MPIGKSNDELTDLALVQTYNNKKVELSVVSAKRLTKIKEAIEATSRTRSLQADIRAVEEKYQLIEQSERQAHAAHLRRIEDQLKDDLKKNASNDAERQRLRVKAEQDRSAAEEAFTKQSRENAEQLAAQKKKLEKDIQQQKQEDEDRAASIARTATKKLYDQASIYRRLEYHEEVASKLAAHQEELKLKQESIAVDKQKTSEEITFSETKLATAKAALLSAQQEYSVAKARGESEEELTKLLAERAQHEAEVKHYTELVTDLHEQQQKLGDDELATSAAIGKAEKDKLDAVEAAAKERESIRKAEAEYYKTSTTNASRVYEQHKTKVAELEAEIAALTSEIEVNVQAGVNTEDIQKLKNTLADKKASKAEEEAAANATYNAAIDDKAIKEVADTIASLTEKLDSVKATSATDVSKQHTLEKQTKTAETKLETATMIEDLKYEMSVQGRQDAKENMVAGMQQNALAAVGESLSNLGNALNNFTKQIDTDIDSFYEYQATVEARLQGANASYQGALKTISKNVGLSGIVSQKEVINNLKKLSDSGIAYNLELRAFLATISDDIAQTFDVFDSNLLRLIRLQQSDTTAARMGMEASLNRLFNEYFSDSSYLNAVADDVSAAILEANSQLTKSASVEFEYMVQKWLGALYSVGMDSSTISTIAQGLNYLGTGDVESLNSNESLQSLLAMSATRAGISYGDILNGGLDAETTNTLMKSMVEYLQSIAENTDNNQVTKSAYSNVFGFNISDLTAVSSLSSSDINNLYNDSLSYQGAMNEYSTRANQIATNTHASQILNTIFENAVASASTTIGNNIGIYGTWKTLNLIEDLTGGIAIPAISVMGNMVDLHQTVTGLAKAGIAGLSLMGSVTSALFSGNGLGGTMDVNKWGYNEYTSRGSSTKGISKGIASGFSSSSSFNSVGSSSSSDMKSSTLSDATDSADEDAKITNKNVEENADIYEKIYAAIGDESTSVLSEIITLNTFLAENIAEVIAGINVTNELLREDRVFAAKISGMDQLQNSLDANRVFYSTIVSVMPLDSSSFAYDTTTSILGVKSSAILSSFAEATKTTTSYATDTMKSVETTANNLLGSTAKAISGITSSSYSSSGVYNSTNTSSSNSSSSSSSGLKQSTKTIAKLESELTNTDIQNISNLMAQTSVGIRDSNDKTTNQLVTNEGLKVSLNQMSPEVSAYFAATIRSMVASAINGGTTTMDAESGEVKTLEDIIASAVANKTMDVRVTNDYFDTALEKAAFSQ